MIERVSKSVADWLLKENVVEYNNRQLLSYAIYSLIFGLLPVFIVMVLGIVFGMIYEGMLMLVPYMLIRKFSGGYHLNSPGVCIICSSFLLAFALALVKLISCASNTFMFTLATSISLIILCILSPIDSEARRLTERERFIFKNVSRIIALCTFLIYIGLLYFQSIRNAIPIGMGINIAASLQLPCLIGIAFRRK